jgi:hypothetical protein
MFDEIAFNRARCATRALVLTSSDENMFNSVGDICE